MRKFISGLIFAVLVVSCSTNPFTGKSTLNFQSNDQIFPTAFAEYDQFLKEHKVITGTADAESIKRVGQRIAKAAERWFNANGYEGYLKDYRWEYNLVQDEAVNAWCMPGGKIVFYTGILPITKTDTGIAVVMGHEVAHALANHGAQRMSAATLQQYGALAGNLALGMSGSSAQTIELFNQAYGIGSQVGVMLPFSRSHESEADAIGLRLMAIAGYNPEEAVKLWQRMSQMGGEAPPEIMSTHPSNETRIQNLKQLVPAAKQEAAKFGVTSFE
ncbi:M48 family metallopeptidase [Galbibacter pacificus]|uniref:M48 family metallopeptidase n=1 Tax=Galbibacter pacificus TaxID=2996052 RepID=A0ABT6FPI9_9FLAO|nr:M48 family metallopeptidase [Galbibacter pacificus]MDG3582345.1 M48 family metallopeptidase [Galbibacter pacificus]MDG3585179.1 M48 family metallopeptidase [Galbibacter pacificus]